MSLDHHPEQSGRDGSEPAGGTSRGKWRWIVYTLLTLVLGWIAAYPEYLEAVNGNELSSIAEARAHGRLLGAGLGMLLGSYLMAAVFLAWSRRTRRFIPGTAFCLALLSFLGRTGSMEAAGETEAQFAAMQRWADSLGTANLAEEDAPPSTTEARMAWVTRMALQDMAEHVRARQEAHGIHADTFPAAWGTAEYLADARAHPEVRAYFTAYRSYLQELDSTEMSVLRDRAEFRMLQSGLRGQVLDAMRASVRASTDSLSESFRQRSIDELAWVNTALELHDFLVRVDARVHLDREAGLARFARRSEQNRAVELSERYERLWLALERQRQASRERLRDVRSTLGDRP